MSNIFSARVSKANQFDPYIGKGLWVKCMVMVSSQYVYIKPLMKLPDGRLYYNYFYEHVLQDPDMEYVRSELSEIAIDLPSKFMIVKPVETLTLEDILGDFDESSIDRYIGKDIWVKCHIYKYAYDDLDCYAKFISVDGDIVTFLCVDAALIEEHEPKIYDMGDEAYVPTEHEVLNYPDTTTLEGILIHKPLTAYTTDEILEELSQCESYEEDDDWDD